MPDWYRNRGYPHLDWEVHRGSASALAFSHDAVAHHPFSPLMRFTKVQRRRRGTTKERVIQYAAHLDGHIYSHYTHVLAEQYERILRHAGLSDSVLAYRRVRPFGNSSVHFAMDVFREIARRQNCVALCFDVGGFFDNIDHRILRDAWMGLLGTQGLPDDHFAVFKSITHYSWTDRERICDILGFGRRCLRGPGRAWTKEEAVARRAARVVQRRICTQDRLRDLHRQALASGRPPLINEHAGPRGIPQGTPISALLSNVVMLPLDERMSSFAQQHGCYYRRYCDDILIVVSIGCERAAEAAVVQALRALKLEIKQAKTERIVFSGGCASPGETLQYLGLLFDGRQVAIRHSSIARHQAKRFQAVNAAKRAGSRRATGQVCVKPLLRKFSHLGAKNDRWLGGNFITYGQRVAAETGDRTARDQVARSVESVLEQARER